jgi:hypothetical protein
MLQPGDCSPSRNVVSKMTIGREVREDMVVSLDDAGMRVRKNFAQKTKNPEAGRASGFYFTHWLCVHEPLDAAMAVGK